jgi:iron(III) transport system permease protein
MTDTVAQRATARPGTLRLAATFERSLLIWILLVLVLALLVGTPVISLVTTSLRSEQGLTLDNYGQMASSARLRTAAGNTLTVATAVGVLSLVVGTLMAWAVAKTDMPLRGPIRLLVFGSFITPPFLGANAWVLLAGPNAGSVNRAFTALTGHPGPLTNIFSLPGLIFVESLYAYPFVFIAVTAALELISDDMEDSARLLGASRWAAARQIVVPLAAPAILAGAILAFLEAAAVFGTPAILGIPARVPVMTTELFRLFTYPPQEALAAAYSMPLLVLTALVLVIQRRLLGRRGYASVTGRAGQRRITELGVWRWPFLAFCLVVVGLAVVLPYLQLLLAAVSTSWLRPPEPGNLTFAHFYWVLFEYEGGRQALQNSLRLGILTGTAGAIIAALLAYVVNRRLLPGTHFLAFAAMVPIVVPAIVIAVGLYTVYTKPPLVLYGTLWIMFVAYLTRYLPLAFSNTDSTIKSIHSELEDAARIFGANRLRAFWDITAPLIRNGVLAAWVLLFVAALRELSSSILLFTGPTRVISVEIYDMYSIGKLESAAVMGILLLALTLGVIAVASRVIGKNYIGVRE